MGIINAKSLMIKELLETSEFLMAKRAKSQIYKDMKYLGEIKEFEKKQDIFNLKRYKNEDISQLIQELEEEYKRLSSIPEIREYFAAENAINSLINNMFDEIRSNINYNLN